MESGYAAQPSSTGIQPLLSSLPVPCPFIYSFSQAFLFALTLSQCCPTFHRCFPFCCFFVVSDTLSIKTSFMLTLPQCHTPMCLSWRNALSFGLPDAQIKPHVPPKAVVPTFWLKTKGIKSAVMASKSGFPGFGRICKVL